MTMESSGNKSLGNEYRYMIHGERAYRSRKVSRTNVRLIHHRRQMASEWYMTFRAHSNHKKIFFIIMISNSKPLGFD